MATTSNLNTLLQVTLTKDNYWTTINDLILASSNSGVTTQVDKALVKSLKDAERETMSVEDMQVWIADAVNLAFSGLDEEAVMTVLAKLASPDGMNLSQLLTAVCTGVFIAGPTFMKKNKVVRMTNGAGSKALKVIMTFILKGDNSKSFAMGLDTADSKLGPSKLTMSRIVLVSPSRYAAVAKAMAAADIKGYYSKWSDDATWCPIAQNLSVASRISCLKMFADTCRASPGRVLINTRYKAVERACSLSVLGKGTPSTGTSASATSVKAIFPDFDQAQLEALATWVNTGKI